MTARRQQASVKASSHVEMDKIFSGPANELSLASEDARHLMAIQKCVNLVASFSTSAVDLDLTSIQKDISVMLTAIEEGHLAPELKSLQERLKVWGERLVEALPDILSNLAKELQQPLYGGMPDFLLGGGLLISIDAKRMRAKGDVRSGPICPLRKWVVSIVEDFSLLQSIGLGPEVFLKECYAAYREILLKDNASIGHRVPVNSLISALAWRIQDPDFRIDPWHAQFRQYPRAAFRLDLYRLLLTPGSPIIDGKTLTLESGSFSNEAVLAYVPQLQRCAYVGRIMFS